ncbi:hypothetical protein [Halobacillus salinus]|uniref:Uncharacterized protein n=1 Tax=Halobacillus salinus TaxID=192814 RepID=A0A4Z0H153_9BACI|nr:hypothetical protein [Halobacillus salinus]TGB03614.1 hypothetical protein E4663_00990 [Halobacillus salinus]
MKSVMVRWGSVFIIGLLLFVGTYYVAMDMEYLSYGVNDKGQFVLHEGFNEPAPILNTDVRGEQEGLAKLGEHMATFNQWVMATLVVAAFFIATYYVLVSEKALGNHQKKKRYLSLTIVANVAVAGLLLVQWIRYADLINKGINNVIF